MSINLKIMYDSKTQFPIKTVFLRVCVTHIRANNLILRVFKIYGTCTPTHIKTHTHNA